MSPGGSVLVSPDTVRVVEKDAYGVPGTRAGRPRRSRHQSLDAINGYGDLANFIGSIAAQRRLDGLVKSRRMERKAGQVRF